MDLRDYVKERHIKKCQEIHNNYKFDEELFNNMNLYIEKLKTSISKDLILNNSYDIIESNGDILKSFLITNESNNINIRFNWFNIANNSSIKSISISNDLFNENKFECNSLITIYLNKDNFEGSCILFNIIETLFNTLNKYYTDNIIIDESFINKIFINETNLYFSFLEKKKEINKNIKKINTYIKENLDNKYFIEHFNKNLDINNNKKTYINISFNNKFNKINR